MNEQTYKKRSRIFLERNYNKYTKDPIKIGFTKSFPEHPDKSKVIDEMSVTMECRGHNVVFKVRYGTVTFGEGEGYSCSGITTDRCVMPRTGPTAGWGDHSYADEAAAMELAVIKMAAKHNLMICEKICSWPFAKAIVQPVMDVHIKFLN